MSLRTSAAEIFRQITPQGPLYGPPTPEGIKLSWPSQVRGHIPQVVSKAHYGFYSVKDKIFYAIRGR